MTNHIDIYETTVAVWEDTVNEKEFINRVMRPVQKFLQRRGWTIGKDPRIEANYKILSPSHRVGVKGELHCSIESSGRHFKVEIWQEKYNRENRHGGKYDFDKRKRMPYLLGLRCDLEMSYLTAYLKRITGYEVTDRRKPRRQTAMEFLAKRYAECWHTDKALGHPKIHDYNNRANDGTLTHGCTVYFFTDNGRIMRGQAFYNLNNMWWVKLGEYGITNLASNQLYLNLPANPRQKRNKRRRRQRLEGLLAEATLRQDFAKAQIYKNILFGDQKLFRIWAKDHSAWYRPVSCGYTESVTHAGLYTEEEKANIMRRADPDLKAVAV